MSLITLYIKDFQDKKKRSPTDKEIAQGLRMPLTKAQKMLKSQLNEGRLQFVFDLANGKEIELK